MTLPWRPTAELAQLRLRAQLLRRIRDFFAAREVLEVDTPVLAPAAATDPALRSFRTHYDGPGLPPGQILHLHTSPEFPMKRLLAAGSGPIYQLCKAFRDGEAGRHHNPEFTLLEWYRPGWDHERLMVEVEELLRAVSAGLCPAPETQCYRYAELFQAFLGVDPLTADVATLSAVAAAAGVQPPAGMPEADSDPWLDLLLTHCIEPRLPEGLIMVYDYPASQAALARVRADDPPVAERFEVYWNGVELANGFHELLDAREQRRRFEHDNARRRQRGLTEMPLDERFLAALEQGLPPCAGVALGVDRLHLLIAGATRLDQINAFPIEVA